MSGRTIYLIMWSLILAACTSDDGQPSDGSTVPVAFSATMASDNKPTTRASGDDIDNSSTSAFGQVIDEDKLQAQGFGVFACYTGLHGYGDSNVHPDFMYNEKVTYKTGHWEYNPVKYWPNGEGEVTDNTGSEKHYVSFMAYAPYSEANNNDPASGEAADYCISSFSLQREVGNPWLTYRLHTDVEKQVDLLYAVNTNEHQILDLSKPAINTPVSFAFRHALACVGDQVTIGCHSGLKNQLISRIKGSVKQVKEVVTGIVIEYTLTSKARLVLWNNGEANWETIWSEEPTCTRAVTLLNPNSDEDDVPVYTYDATDSSSPTVTERSEPWKNKGVFYIPIELTGYPQTAKVTITYHASVYNGSTWVDDTNTIGTATLKLKDYPDAYKEGNHLYINVTLNQMDIALTAAIAPWIEADPVEVEGIEE